MKSDLPKSREYLMKQFKLVGLAVVMALMLVACLGATSASATTICVTGTVTAPCTDGMPGGTVTLRSTNGVLGIHGSSSIQCSTSTIEGNAPTTSATWVTVRGTLSYSGCTAFGILHATVGVGANCEVSLHVMFNNPLDSQSVVTVPGGCVIDINVPSINCTVTVNGPFNFGATWTNGNSSTLSSAHITSALVPDVTVHAGGGFGCPSAGTHSGTLSGLYRVSSPATAPGVTVID